MGIDFLGGGKMTDQAKKFKRKNYFILKGFQLRFSVIIFITAMVLSLVSVWTTYVVTWDEIAKHVQSSQFSSKLRAHYSQGQGFGENIELINSIFTVEFSGVFDRVANSLMLRLLASSFILFVLSIFASHKIAGPIFRMEGAANALREGDLTVDLGNLRVGDEFSGLATSLNAAILKTRTIVIRCDQLANKQSTSTIRLVKKLESNSDRTEIETIARELEVTANKLSAELAFFKTKKVIKKK